MNTAIIRLGAEITLKSPRVAKSFRQHLLRNLRAALSGHGIEHHLTSEGVRLRLTWEGSANAAVSAALAEVFGVHSWSFVEASCTPKLDEIVATGLRFADRIAFGTYAVETHRAGAHPFTSVDVNCALGAALGSKSPTAKVKLKNPDTTVYVDVRPEECQFYTDKHPGLGGLPLGSGGRALALFSGGIDSPVAWWRMQKRGVATDLLFCNLGGGAHMRKVLAVAKAMSERWSWGMGPRLITVPGEKLTRAIDRTVTPAYRQVVLKRLLYRLGCRLCGEDADYRALITGESLGQVSSQTLVNLATIERVATVPVLRPLIAADKSEIIAEARKLGTFDASSRVPEHCQLGDAKPVTAATAERADAEEAKIDAALVDELLAARQVLRLAEYEDEDGLEFVFVDSIPEGAEVIDCQPREEFARWHYPGARSQDIYELVERPDRSLEKRGTYVLYCPVGTQSALAAERLQEMGYDAYSLRGGVPSLQRLLAATNPQVSS